ncbi:Retrovirus-related Pol polyprotein from transposon 17.6 [Vitis vinifera]|uniref:Retrovirus-related Pol polyprotein from transposon 17.6 n=1 Tax=Vitis vinifera TaxID=29760 RepID=A0A438FNW5_VITVI|nr:Retrovirus-related Pol polyprotein from transposon 17.6 [Vitis vinifera]
MLSLCFPEEITGDGITSIVQLQPVSAFDMFGVSTIEVFEGTQTLPVPELPEDDSSLFEGIVSPVEGASDLVDPPLSFDVLSGFVSRSDDVSVASFMDLSIFEYSPALVIVPLYLHPTHPLHIFDINDEVAWPDSDRDSSDHDSDPVDERVSPDTGMLRLSYLDVFAWSYEDMPGLDPSIVQHHLPILPHVRPVKQKLRRLHPRWSLQVKEEIQKQLSVGFISVVEYPEWLANVVPVPKKDGKAIRCCLSWMDSRGATYQRAATTLFHDMMHRDVEVYVDDMIVKSRVTSGKLLGHMVSDRGIEVDPDKIKAILDMPVPRTEKEIRGFLGRLQYISRFIARLTDICEPIFRLLRKNQPTVWNDDCQIAFEKIKEYLLSPPVLVPPMPGRPLLLYLSVSDMALGCMLAQLDDSGKERAIYYLSKRMLEYEMRYVMIERMCLALVWATRRLRHYMTEYSVCLISRLDPLRYLFDRPALTGRLMRWLVLLTEFDIQYVSQKSIKGSIVADHLASLPISEGRPVDDDFPDEEFIAMTSLSGWRMYFDGAANQLGFGIGVLLISPQGDHIPRWKYLVTPISYSGRFREIGRLGIAQNQFADALATLASSVDIPIDVVIRPLLIESSFLDLAYTQRLPLQDRRALRQLATRFVICGETLYRRSADGMLLLCLDRASADRVMREVHAGVCGPHMGGHMLARKIMRMGYFWLTMETDCCQFVQKCPECQIHGDLIHAPPSELHALTSPWHFQYFVAEVCIHIIRSSAYRPQTNGAVEAANKNIKRILRKMVETSRDWSEKLPFALWAYRTSFRTSTGATPYSLVYGMEAVLPVETEMGSLRVALEQQISETEWAQARFDQLNLLDERRLRAADHVQAYQRKMARAFKKRVKPRPLQKGDLVLRILRGLIGDPRGKFRPSWSGPYVIRELTPEGAAWLTDLDGNQFSEPTNVDQLKKYYV